ncbi:unnamed protein product [Cylicocyclus nassatus]|uniref:Chromo domain-containing protein n=1 Tax=Cylicocyclus nassatus TaxID=53992 RepID=A0AA36MB08_CYLNA|nr:unnamed protein product [Cylicocyclus nassatus]
MDEQDGEEEYQVESIVTHLEYVEAFDLRGYIVFNPATGNGLTHSKYVYLVKWVGYDEADNTWEPEENLVDCTELLTLYKEKHDLPLYHETFNRRFNWKEPTTSMTLEEVNRRAFKNRDPITSASQLLRDPPTKKRKKRREVDLLDGDVDEPEIVHRKIRKTSPTVDSSLKSDSRRRGPKKKTTLEGGTPKKPGRKPRSAAATEEKKRKRSESEDRIELVRYIVEGASHRSRSPARRLLKLRRYSSAERLRQRWDEAIRKNTPSEWWKSMTREKLAKIFTSRFANSTEELASKKKMIVSLREKEELDENSKERQCRVVGSSILKKLLKENNLQNRLPLPAKTSVVTGNVPNGLSAAAKQEKVEVSTKSASSVALTEGGCSLDELRHYAHETSLVDSEKFLESIRSKDLSVTDETLLVIALCYAELSHENAVRTLSAITDAQTRFVLVKVLVNTVRIVGNAMITRPQQLEEPNSSLALQLIESDLSAGDWFETVSHCSASHWKCRLLHQLITLCPNPEVYVDVDSPFCTKNFLHCMRYGAHCQKLAFIKNGVPFGHETIPFDLLDVSVNESHISAVQGNPRYFLEFIRSGLDVSSLTSKPSSSRLDSDLTVCSLLEKLISMKTGDSGQAFEVDAKIRNQISNMIGVIADWENIEQRFVRDAVERRLQMDQRCEVMFDRTLSPVHTLRVSSYQDEMCIRTAFFGNISTPILARILSMVQAGKSAVVLCIYAISIIQRSLELDTSKNETVCALNLDVVPEAISGCSVTEASLEDVFTKRRFILTLDDSSSSDSEWYFVMDNESLGHISTNTMPLRLRLNAPPNSLFLAQFVLVSRKDDNSAF